MSRSTLPNNHQHPGYTWVRVRRGALRAVLLALLWWVLTAGDPASWVVGVPVVAIATLASLALLPASLWSWRVTGMARFLPFFLWQSLRGGIDVARRALHPRLSLAPLLLDYPLRLPDGPARTFLANTVSLLPGTLSADLENGCLTVHVLDGSQPDVSAELQSLEALVADLFGVELSQSIVTMERPHA